MPVAELGEVGGTESKTRSSLASVANRLARIERGRRTEKAAHSGVVLPGSTTSLPQTEKNKRSEEMLVAEYDPDPEQSVSYETLSVHACVLHR